MFCRHCGHEACRFCTDEKLSTMQQTPAKRCCKCERLTTLTAWNKYDRTSIKIPVNN